MKKFMIFLLLVTVLVTFGCTRKVVIESNGQQIELPQYSKEELKELTADKEAQAEQLNAQLDELKGLNPLDNLPTAEEVMEETKDVESMGDDMYKMIKGSSVVVNGKEISLDEIKSGPLVDITVDETQVRFIETKSDEIAEELTLSIQEFKFRLKDSPENYVVLKVQPLALGVDEYLLEEDEVMILGDKTIQLIEARTDGSIYVDVDPSTTGNTRITAGNTKTIENLEITNLKTFTKDPTRLNYAILKIVIQA